MDSQTTDLFFAIAQIAGIFVGFGALISFSRDRRASVYELFMIRAVVTVGLFILVGALLPLLLSVYGMEGALLWRVSGAILFISNLASIYAQFAASDVRQAYGKRARTNMVGASFFWILLEGSSQLAMILLIIGLLPEFGMALYTTVLIINLFQATYLLAAMVYGREGPGSDDDSSEMI